MNFREAVLADNGAIRSLLERVALPAESVGTNTTTFYVGTEDDKLVAVAGYEFYGKDALLRSVAIDPGLQKKGIGSKLVDFMLGVAKRRGIKRVVLLTDTAPKFFATKGFIVTERSTIQNEGLKRSSEFSYLCPSSSICMVLDLTTNI
jgi:N-acetylglutamate synthase-like GNAT family acetyltransferase